MLRLWTTLLQVTVSLIEIGAFKPSVRHWSCGGGGRCFILGGHLGVASAPGRLGPAPPYFLFALLHCHEGAGSLLNVVWRPFAAPFTACNTVTVRVLSYANLVASAALCYCAARMRTGVRTAGRDGYRGGTGRRRSWSPWRRTSPSGLSLVPTRPRSGLTGGLTDSFFGVLAPSLRREGGEVPLSREEVVGEATGGPSRSVRGTERWGLRGRGTFCPSECLLTKCRCATK